MIVRMDRYVHRETTVDNSMKPMKVVDYHLFGEQGLLI